MAEKEFRKASRNRHFHQRPENPTQPRDPKRRFSRSVATRGKSLEHLADYCSCTRGSFCCRLRIQLTPSRKGVQVVLPKGVIVDQRFDFFCDVISFQVLDKVRHEVRLWTVRLCAHAGLAN